MLGPAPLAAFKIRVKQDSWLELAYSLMEFDEVHLVKGEGELFQPDGRLSEYVESLVKAREALLSSLGRLGVSIPPPMIDESTVGEFVKTGIAALSEELVFELCERATKIAAELSKIEDVGASFIEALERLLRDIDLGAVKRAKFFAVVAGIGPLNLWERISRRIPYAVGYAHEISKEAEALCVVTPTSTLEEVRSALAEEGFREVEVEVVAAPKLLLEVARIEAFLKTLIEVASHFKIEDETLEAWGYVAEERLEELRTAVESRVKGLLGFEVVEPGEEIPTRPRPLPLLDKLRDFAWTRGVPTHWSLDPTPFMVTLFVIMYGFMFGDLGLGAIILASGLALLKSGRPLLGFHPRSIAGLGLMLALCGVSSLAFGSLYGVAFLVKVVEHPVLNPLHDMWGIIGVALLFGALQLVIGTLLNIANHVRAGDYRRAIYSGRGVLGMIYYIPGIYLGYVLAVNGLKFSLLVEWPHVLALLTSLASLAAAVIAPKLVGDEGGLTKGVIDVIEMLIEYPANTLSYMRLAIFAIAHEIFASVAEMLSELATPPLGYLIANMLVLIVEGFAAGIQALRLTYYEFSSKFMEEEGMPFTPIRKTLISNIISVLSR